LTDGKREALNRVSDPKAKENKRRITEYTL
jgi:hypothetical protein